MLVRIKQATRSNETVELVLEYPAHIVVVMKFF